MTLKISNEMRYAVLKACGGMPTEDFNDRAALVDACIAAVLNVIDPEPDETSASGEVPMIYWQPESEHGPACLVIEMDGPKRYLRWWDPLNSGRGSNGPSMEWGHALSESAIRLVPAQGKHS